MKKRASQVSAVFNIIMELEPRYRNAELDHLCKNDVSLRARVEALISASERAAAAVDVEHCQEVTASNHKLDPPGKNLETKDPLNMIGRQVSKYRILEAIGKGGMGVVYKGYDLLLERTVAIKFLSPRLIPDASLQQQLITEARVVSRLDHPGIASVFDIDTTPEGLLFIVMGYYEGSTLKKLIASERLSLDTIIDYAIQVAEGLAFSHRDGVIHRDINPSNLLVSDHGEIKIVDFGLAKLANQDQSSESGKAVGTVGYMSPEQLLGEPVDERTDIWALGVVIHEMVFNRKPVWDNQGKVCVTLHECLHAAKESSSDLELVKDVLRMTAKALEKDPGARYGSMEELLDELNDIEANIDLGDPVTAVGRNRYSIRAIAVAASLFVGAILIVLAGLGYYDIKHDGLPVFGVKYTTNPEAFNLYLRGREYAAKETDHFLKLAVVSYDRAIALDSNFALAHAGKTVPLFILGDRNAFQPKHTAYALARQSALRAIELDASLPDGHLGLAVIQSLVDRDQDAARESYVKAIGLDSRHVEARREFGLFLLRRGEIEQALKELETARSIEPENIRVRRDVSRAYYFNRKYEESISGFNDLLILNPGSSSAYRYLSLAQLQLGLIDEALESYENVMAAAEDSAAYIAFYGEAYAAAGRREEALEIIQRLHGYWGEGKVPAYHQALVYTSLGDTEEAIRWLEQAKKDNDLPSSLISDPRWDRLRQNETFQSFLRE